LATGYVGLSAGSIRRPVERRELPVSVVVVGLNHRTVPLDLFERMTVPSARLPKALADLARRLAGRCRP